MGGGTTPWMEEIERSRSQSREQRRERLPRVAVVLTVGSVEKSR